ncbi:MAG: ABC-type Fe3+-hydroxamate transport system, substrate-binding protein [Chloroflexi bacterium]|nr:MAG: ABC-type Fe3+-hydroxamate transport system, substrate-binding protein [Chloroflexota bacterium]
MPTVQDARGRDLTVEGRPRRIVSLVPSLTESVAALTGADRLVGITKFCTQPEDDVPAIQKVGGTKDPDLDAIVALAPELVLANQEENRAEDIEALEAAGLTVFVGYPRTVPDSVEELRTIAKLIGGGLVRSLLSPIEDEIARQESLREQRPTVRVFCPIWRAPYMAVGGDTYAGDMIRLAGGTNVFENHARGNRYPQVQLSEIAAADPEVILLPDEPYRFGRRHRDEMLALRSITAARERRIHLVDGRWLTWHGKRATEGLAGLEALLDQARPTWEAPARPVLEKPKQASKKTAGKTGASKRTAGKTGASKKTAGRPTKTPVRSAAKKAGPSKKATPAPKRAPKTETALPPGLKLRVRSQEVVEE